MGAMEKRGVAANNRNLTNPDVRCNTRTCLSSAGIPKALQLTFVQSSYSGVAGYAGHAIPARFLALPAPA
jgi:hypothetical protein